MKRPVRCLLRQRERETMGKFMIGLLAAVLFGLTVLVACNDKDTDEQQSSASKAVAGQQTAAQKPAQKPDADEGEEGEEGPATPAAVAAEKPAPQQPPGKQSVYNFDNDTPGQLPAKFHGAKTGGGPQEKWAVTADPTAPSKPNVVTQTSTDQTDYRFPLLISDEGSFQDLDLSVKFKAVSGNIDRAGGLVFRLRDPNNYYIVRANALENNYRLYHVVSGRRSQLRKRQEGTGGLGFLDANGKKTGDIVIDAHPESFQLEEAGTRLFVNVPDKNEIEVIDAVKRTVLARWPVSFQNNFPMALDETHHRLFVGCWMPPRLLVFDTATGKEVASGEIAGPTDDLFYDARRGRVYVLTSQGFLDVFQEKDPDHYERIARYPTPPHTQTGLFVPEWGKLFAAAQQQGEQSAEVRVYQAH